MKVKLCFVTNSSSTSYIIHNKTNEYLDLTHFVLENPHLIDDFVNHYEWHKDDPEMTLGHLLVSAEENNETLKPGDNVVVFGDESGTLIGRIMDYILRDGGSSKSFTWKYHQSLR